MMRTELELTTEIGLDLFTPARAALLPRLVSMGTQSLTIFPVKL